VNAAVLAAGEPLACARLERVFAACFAGEFGTRLVGGAPEPLYRPSREPGEEHRLCYREDYFASALHEVAHWCIAGPERRLRVDFGYWYLPDGRTPEQQRSFESVEYRPQALEWFFSKACGHRFRVSADNLRRAAGDLPGDRARFSRQILEQALSWREDGLPGRAARFFHGLCREFGTSAAPGELAFTLAELD
jgi:elongation factor P hydroxylase